MLVVGDAPGEGIIDLQNLGFGGIDLQGPQSDEDARPVLRECRGLPVVMGGVLGDPLEQDSALGGGCGGLREFAEAAEPFGDDEEIVEADCQTLNMAERTWASCTSR